MIDMTTIQNADPEVYEAMRLELSRQRDNIELIASENFVSPAVMAAVGSHLTNKYAEGLPGKRYYGGCQYVDIVENLAIERCKQLFGCEHANVQPHSGAQANTAVYFALLTPGDTILGMNLSHGGHLSHGSPVNISGKYFKVVPYGVSEKDERIDGRAAPFARAVCGYRDHDHAQNAARPARRRDHVQGTVRQGDRQGGVPRHAGRPAHARHRRQGGRL